MMLSTTCRWSRNGRTRGPSEDGSNGSIRARWEPLNNAVRDTYPPSPNLTSPFGRRALGTRRRWLTSVVTATPNLITAAATSCVAALSPYVDRDWRTAMAAELDWSCWDTALHITDSLYFYAVQLLHGPDERVPLAVALTVDDDTRNRRLLRVLTRPHLISPPLARTQPPAPGKRLSDLRLGQHLRGFTSTTTRPAVVSWRKSGTCRRSLSPSQPDTQNGWLATHRTDGSKSGQPDAVPLKQAFVPDQGTGRGGPQPPGIVPLALVRRERSHRAASDNGRTVNLAQSGRDPLTAAVEVAELHVR